MKQFYSLLLIFCCCANSFAQRMSIAEIDTLLTKESNKLRMKGKFHEAILLNKRLIKNSEKIGYKKGRVVGLINLGNIYCTTEKYEESLKSLKKAHNLIGEMHEPFQEIRLYGEYGRNYHILGFYEKSNEMVDRAIKLNSYLKDKKQKAYITYIYSFKVDNFESTNNIDSMYFYLKKIYYTKKNPHNSARIGAFFLEKRKNIDSAEFYINHANQILSISPIDANKSFVFVNYGKLYYAKGEYSKALSYYEKALGIQKKTDIKNGSYNLFKLLSQTYKALGNTEKSVEYLEKYTIINDSLNNVKRKAIDIPVKEILEETEISHTQQKDNLYLIIASIILISAISIGLFYGRHKKIKNKKDKEIEEKENVILEKEEETILLKQKVNEAFNELVLLAKKNDSTFFSRFQEVYPEFSEKLLKINPKLQTSELTFCAMLFLNFSTKDISEYTFVTVSAVQLRKNRLRKKLGISSEQDLYLWMNRLIFPLDEE